MRTNENPIVGKTPIKNMLQNAQISNKSNIINHDKDRVIT
jgi:hypothetical protein